MRSALSLNRENRYILRLSRSPNRIDQIRLLQLTPRDHCCRPISPLYGVLRTVRQLCTVRHWIPRALVFQQG